MSNILIVAILWITVILVLTFLGSAMLIVNKGTTEKTVWDKVFNITGKILMIEMSLIVIFCLIMLSYSILT